MCKRLLAVFCVLILVNQLKAQLPGQVIHYTFDNQATDKSGYGNNGEIVGGAQPAPGIHGGNCGALHFNGKDAYIKVPFSTGLKNLASVTVAAWVKAEKPANGKSEVRLPLLSTGTAADGSLNPGYHIQYQQLFWDARAQFNLSSDIMLEDKDYETRRLSYDKWYHIALVIDEGVVQFYLDAKLVWQGADTRLVAANKYGLEIGRDFTGGPQYFAGTLDNFSLFAKGLTAKEIGDLYNNELKEAESTELVLGRPFVSDQPVDKDKCSTVINYEMPTANIGCKVYEVKLAKGNGPGTAFDFGPHEVVYDVLGLAEGKKQISFSFNVLDNQEPQLACPANMVAKTPPGTNGTAVSYNVNATDNCPNVKTKLLSGLSSGSVFPLGATQVKYDAADAGGNHTSCTFVVTVEIDERPITRCPLDTIVYTTANANEVPVNYSVPYVEYKGEKIALTQVGGIAPGGIFKVGQNEVMFNGTSPGIENARCVFKIIVKDTTPPQINCIDNIAAVSANGQNAVVSFTMPTATASDGGRPLAVTQVEGPASGEKFPVGATRVVFKATDAAGNSSTCSFTVTVSAKSDGSQPPRATAHDDNPPKTAPAKTEPSKTQPVKNAPAKTEPAAKAQPEKQPWRPLDIACGADVQKNTDPGKCGVVVNYNAPKVQGQEVKTTLTKGLNSGSVFPAGNTDNVFTATDANGTSRQCGFTVHVKDNEPPTIQCPHDTTIILNNNRRGIIFNYIYPTATDNCRADSIIQTEGSKVGCFLPIGVHPFAFTVKDTAGNVRNCDFTVTIKTNEVVEEIVPPAKLLPELEMGADAVKYEHKATLDDCLLTIYIYDDGEEDGDSVSIIFDGQILVNRAKIKLKDNGPIKRQLVLSSNNPNYIIAKAWNTGSVGLNTLKIDIYEGYIENDKRDLKNKKPVFSKVMHSKPGEASGVILKCKW